MCLVDRKYYADGQTVVSISRDGERFATALEPVCAVQQRPFASARSALPA